VKAVSLRSWDLERDRLAFGRQPLCAMVDWSFAPVSVPIPEDLGAEEAQRHQVFQLKVVFGLLPLMSRQHVWFPALYPDAYCRRCANAAEDWAHVLACPAINSSVFEEIDLAVYSAMDEILAKSGKRRCARSWFKFSCGAINVLRSPEWCFQYIRPYWPKQLAIFAGCPVRIAKAALARGMFVCRQLFLDRIWKPRCQATNDWELRQDPPITPALKRTKQMRISSSPRSSPPASPFLIPSTVPVERRHHTPKMCEIVRRASNWLVENLGWQCVLWPT